MRVNLWRDFSGVLGESATVVALVVTHRSDGRSVIEFPDGSQTTAQGQSVAEGSYAFVRDDLITGEAPAVSPVTIDV